MHLLQGSLAVESRNLILMTIITMRKASPAVDGFDRVQHITALGVTLCHNFYMSKHIDTVITSCARILYGLRTLRAHGMPQASLQLIFRTTALAKLLYAAPAWWGFANSGDINRLEAFLRRAGKLGYYTGDVTITSLCEQADDQLFGHSDIIPCIRFIISYHLSAAHHTSLVPEYIIMSYPPKQQY